MPPKANVSDFGYLHFSPKSDTCQGGLQQFSNHSPYAQLEGLERQKKTAQLRLRRFPKNNPLFTVCRPLLLSFARGLTRPKAPHRDARSAQDRKR